MKGPFQTFVAGTRLLSLAILATLHAAAQTSPTTDQSAAPVIFAPGVISSPADDTAPTFTPDGQTIYFARSNGAAVAVMESQRKKDGGWTPPKIAPFSGRWHDLEAVLSPDGKFMIFASNRPDNGGDKALDGAWGGKNYPGHGGNLWRVERQGQAWGAPVRLAATVNSSNSVFSPSIVRDGSLYLMKASPETGHFQIYRSQLVNGAYQPAERLPFSKEDSNNVDPTVAPDESFMVFASSRPPTADKDLDLFIVFRQNGQWGEPVHLGPVVNSPSQEIEPRLGPDGHRLYFSSNRIVPVTLPASTADTERALQRMVEWDNGRMNLWSVDLAPWLKKAVGSQQSAVNSP
ncbi:MAG TPA: hypothetical protein VKZ53_30985 [Candidatus Angelobacter sp.]|nr:hypothetical protein [Candidatus Angelobacter sp.]